jgi:hypothetical protein
MLANFRATKNKGKFFDESVLALYNHPTADELSQKLRKHSLADERSNLIACQTAMIAAINSRQLFLVATLAWNLSGIFRRHALPE